MLDKNERKQLKDHNLLYMLKHSSNVSLKWKRIKEKSIRAINDLSLIASKSPDDKLQQIFNETTLEKFLKDLFIHDYTEIPAKVRSADVQLASLFADIGISVCIWEYEERNKDTPGSSKPAIDNLKSAKAICRDIGYSYRLDLMKKESVEKKLTFICIWEEIDLKHELKFSEYITKVTPIKGINNWTSKTINPNSMEFYFSDHPEPGEGAYIGKAIININPIQNNGKITFYNENDEKIKNISLVVKKYGYQTALYE